MKTTFAKLYEKGHMNFGEDFLRTQRTGGKVKIAMPKLTSRLILFHLVSSRLISSRLAILSSRFIITIALGLCPHLMPPERQSRKLGILCLWPDVPPPRSTDTAAHHRLGVIVCGRGRRRPILDYRAACLKKCIYLSPSSRRPLLMMQQL